MSPLAWRAWCLLFPGLGLLPDDAAGPMPCAPQGKIRTKSSEFLPPIPRRTDRGGDPVTALNRAPSETSFFCWNDGPRNHRLR
jgi:hypothetical protein